MADRQHVRVAVIIVNFNGGDMLKRCIEDVFRQTRRPDRVIIVDNNSKDSSLAQLGSPYIQDLEIIRLGENIGFAAANNVAIKSVQDCEWVALLNPDAFPHETWLERLVKGATQHKEYVFFASRQLSAGNGMALDGAGDAYHVSGMHWRRGHGSDAVTAFLESQEVFAPCAAAAFYRADVLREAGGFDESYFCYAEDVDLGFRLRLRGCRCLYLPDAVVDHVGSALTGRHSDFSVYYAHRNLVWAFLKNMPSPLLWIYLPQHILFNLVSIVWFSLRGQGRVILAAKRDALRGLPRVLTARRRTQTGRRVGVLEIRRVLTKGIWKPYLRQNP
jgi:GT2 family glycosyltransferase